MRAAALCLLAVCLAAACGGATPAGEGLRTEVYLSLPTLDGQLNFADLRGKIVIAHFATTWSLAAQADHEELRKAIAGGAAVIEIMLDVDVRLVKTWAAAAKLTWPVALAGTDVIDGKSAFGKVALVPATFVLDRGGRIVWAWAGVLGPGQLAPVIVEASRAAP